jgi:hypothetical protein
MPPAAAALVATHRQSLPVFAVCELGKFGPLYAHLTHCGQTPAISRRSLMLMNESVARTKWCPHVRIDNNNRLHNTLTGGFANSEKMYHCIGSDCMSWRQFHLSHLKGSDENLQSHGYCGLAGKLELD